VPETRAEQIDQLRSKAEATIERLRTVVRADRSDAKLLLGQLRDARLLDLMGQLAELLSRLDPDDAKIRRLYAQYLIEAGNVTTAIDVLHTLAARLPPGHPEGDEALGLIGRCYKQIFIEAPDKTTVSARQALDESIAAYHRPYAANRQNTWHGINLVALLTRASGFGLRVVRDDLDATAIAREIIATLEAKPEPDRDPWHFLTLAEAYLALGQWDDVDSAVGAYVNGSEGHAFLCASALRQFREVWNVEDMDERGRAIAAVLRARALELEGHDLRIDPHDVTQLQAIQPPDSTLEAILGDDAPTTYKFMLLGMERAQAVASIRRKLGRGVGTGFLVRASDFDLAPAGSDELLVLTNWHVVSPGGLYPGQHPGFVDIVFEAADVPSAYNVKEIVWASPIQHHDAVFLRLEGYPPGVKPMPIADTLPPLLDQTRVYVIGYPGGSELSLSLQDNGLLDYEGPPAGQPRPNGVHRVHYRAPTQPGSSGSPVFNDTGWSVIALHHAGFKAETARLNGKDGTYLANEGISILSIRNGIAAQPKGFA